MKHAERNTTIAMRVAAGATYAAIGRELGLSRERVRQICASHVVRSPKQRVKIDSGRESS